MTYQPLWERPINKEVEAIVVGVEGQEDRVFMYKPLSSLTLPTQPRLTVEPEPIASSEPGSVVVPMVGVLPFIEGGRRVNVRIFSQLKLGKELNKRVQDIWFWYLVSKLEESDE